MPNCFKPERYADKGFALKDLEQFWLLLVKAVQPADLEKTNHHDWIITYGNAKGGFPRGMRSVVISHKCLVNLGTNASYAPSS